ncbi:MAG: metallophosphoesterase family protein [Candidatus Latescibacterota bacterium]
MRFPGKKPGARPGGLLLLPAVFSAGLFLVFSLSWSEYDPGDWPSWGSYDPLKVLQSKPAPSGEWTFVAYGDTRAAEFHRNHGVPCLCRLNPALIVHTGDAMKYGGGVWTRNIDWIRWELESRALRDSIPFFPVLGNHEESVREPRTADHELQYTGAQHFSRFYDLPGDSGEGSYYSFVYGEVTFVMLSTLEDKLFPGSPQWMWLERTLGEATTPHVVTFSHKDIYTVGDKEDGAWKHAPEFTSLLKKYGVGLHISGHDHIYYRTVRDGVAYVISAGGGSGMYPLGNLRSVISGDKYFSGEGQLDKESYNYYLSCKVHGDVISGEAVSFRTGKVLDRFSVKARKREKIDGAESGRKEYETTDEH